MRSKILCLIGSLSNLNGGLTHLSPSHTSALSKLPPFINPSSLNSWNWSLKPNVLAGAIFSTKHFGFKSITKVWLPIALYEKLIVDIIVVFSEGVKAITEPS